MASDGDNTHDRTAAEPEEGKPEGSPVLTDATLSRLLDSIQITEHRVPGCDTRRYFSFDIKIANLRQVPRHRRRIIQRPPGTHLARCGRFLLTREAYRLYVQPVIADMQHEYCEAIAAGEELRARWIALRGWLLVVPGWLVGVAGRLVRKMFSA